MKLFLDVATALYEAKSFFDVGKILVSILQKLANNKLMNGKIGIYNKEKDEYTIYYNSDEKAESDYPDTETYKIVHTPCKFDEIKYFSRIVADSREKLIIQDNHSEESLKIHPAQGQCESHAMMWMPLVYKDEFLGIISLGSVPANSFTDEIIETIEGITKLTSIKIYELFTSNDLIKNEEKYRVLTESMKDVVWILDTNTMRFTYISPSVQKLRGYTPEEILSEPIDAALTPEGKEYIKNVIHQGVANFLSGKETPEKFYSNEVEQPCKDGSTVWTEVITKYVFNEKTGHVESHGVTRDITERKQMENRIKQSEERLKKAQAIAHVGNWEINPKTNKIWASEEAFHIYGLEYSTDELPLDIVQKSVLPEYRLTLNNALQKLINREGIYDEEFKINQNNTGRILDIHSKAELVLNDDGTILKIVGVLQEITDRKQAEEMVQKNEERMRAIVEGTPHLFFYTQDDKANTTYVSPTIEQITGYKADTWMPKKDWFITDSTINQIAKERTQANLRGEINEEPILLEIYHSNGHPILLEVYEYPIIKNGRIVGLQGVAHNITERKHAEENLKESHRILKETLLKLKDTQKQVFQQEKMRSLGQMASGICHDINNSLTPIMGFLDLLKRDKELMERSKKYIDMVIKSTKNIASTVGRLREFYKVKLENEVLSEKDINKILNTTIGLTSHKWKNMAESTGSVIVIKKDLQKDLPLTKVDESELIEALTNVTLNACDAMTDGGTLTFRTYQKEENIVIEVQDTGIGMDEETLQRCLDPFYSTKGEKGTGLGLAMVFGVIDRHKGEIKVESELKKGTVVKLILPVDKSIIEDKIIDEIVKDLNPLKILSVEDDKVISEMLQIMLEAKGNTTVLALNGKAGLKLYQQAIKNGEPFDLVITDLGMPEIDGISLSKLIKGITPDIPIILLTGFGTIINKDEHPSIDYLLNKPIMMEDLFKAIAGLFKDK